MQKGEHELTLVLVTNNSSATRRKEATEVQAMLREAGIGVEIKYYPGDVLYAPAGMGGILQLGKVRYDGQRLVRGHRSRRQHAVHVRKLSAQRLQLFAVLQRRKCRRLKRLP